MKKIGPTQAAALFVLLSVFMMTFAGNVFAEDLTAPSFSAEGGIYPSAFELRLSGTGNIYYTLDGSEPNVRSYLYTEPIIIDPKPLSPRSVQGRVAQDRIEPGVVVKAVCADGAGNLSEVVTNTYFVSDKIRDISSKVPVIAVSAAPHDLWDEREGIYTNYDYEHNVPAYVEYFDNNGEGFERGVEIKVGGHGSRSEAKKSLRIYFTKGGANGSKYLEYDLIEGTDRNFYDGGAVKKYGKVTLRISDWYYSDLKDVTAQKIGEFMRPDTANSTPAAVFLNGEFWGIYECREQYDNRYFDYHYEGIGKDDIIYLNRDWTNENERVTLPDTGDVYTERLTYEEGPAEDEALYRDIFNYTKYLMLHASEGDNYAELAAYVDIDEFIDYIFVYLYTDNIDWPGNNFKFWRTTAERSNGDTYGADGKWRFIIHDFDLAFDDAGHDTLEYAVGSNQDDTSPRQPQFAAKELDGLFRCEKFRNAFAQRAAAYMSTAVSEENMARIVSKLIAERESVKAYDLMRWNTMSGTSAERLNSWRDYTSAKYLNFAAARNNSFPVMIENFCKKHYGSEITRSADFDFCINSGHASVSVSGAVIRESLYGDGANSFKTRQFAGIPVTISAETEDGYKVSSITVTGPAGTETFLSDSVTITPEAGSYSVILNVEAGDAPQKEVKDFFLARSARLTRMLSGEKLPIDLFTEDGEKLFGFEVASDSDCVSVGENNVITAQKKGSAKLSVRYGNMKKEFTVLIR